MTPKQIKQARHKLGLSIAQMATMLETDAQTVRRMETDPDNSKFREPARRMERLIRAYLDGWRPKDWPISKLCKVMERDDEKHTPKNVTPRRRCD